MSLDYSVGFDQAQPTIFDGDLLTLLEQLKILSEDHSIVNVNGVKETIQNNSIVIKRSVCWFTKGGNNVYNIFVTIRI
jgi:hypothetical protein